MELCDVLFTIGVATFIVLLWCIIAILIKDIFT